MHAAVVVYVCASVSGNSFQPILYREVEVAGLSTIKEIDREEKIRYAVREAVRRSRVSQLRQRVDAVLREMPRLDPAGEVVASMAEEDLRRDCGLEIVSSDEVLPVVGQSMSLEAGRA